MRELMQKNVVETVVGTIVLIVAVGFLVFAYRGSEVGINRSAGYEVKARFSNATGVGTGSDVRIGGIKIGVVSDMLLDPDTYDAITVLHIAKNTKIPADSSASIVGSGLLGEKFVQITPGGDEEMLKEGGVIQFTQASVSLEEMIGKFVFSGGGVDKGEKAGEPKAGAGGGAH